VGCCQNLKNNLWIFQFSQLQISLAFCFSFFSWSLSLAQFLVALEFLKYHFKAENKICIQ
jgi:hypothetical protein